MPANVVVPEVGESIVDARVAKWLKKEGDRVNVGEALVELETDKIDLEVAAPQAGVLAKITHADGEDVKVGDVIGVIEDAGAAKADAPGAAAPEAGPAAPDKPKAADVKPADAKPQAAEQKPDSGKDKTRVTPAARNAAQ